MYEFDGVSYVRNKEILYVIGLIGQLGAQFNYNDNCDNHYSDNYNDEVGISMANDLLSDDPFTRT
jgi:hypothetical protein